MESVRSDRWGNSCSLFAILPSVSGNCVWSGKVMFGNAGGLTADMPSSGLGDSLFGEEFCQSYYTLLVEFVESTSRAMRAAAGTRMLAFLLCNRVPCISKEKAMIELTEQQRHELEADPPRAVDPLTQRVWVLVSEDVYDRIQQLLVPDRLTINEQRTILLAAGKRAGWDDPEMDIYDQEEAPSDRP